MTIRVRRQKFEGKPSIVIFTQDVTKKIRDKLLYIKQREAH